MGYIGRRRSDRTTDGMGDRVVFATEDEALEHCRHAWPDFDSWGEIVEVDDEPDTYAGGAIQG